MLRLDLLTPLYPVDAGITLGEFERLIMGEPYEVVGVFGADRRLILAPKRGLTDRVTFIDAEAPFIRGAVVTHNHPFGGVFSEADVTLAYEQNPSELRIACSGGIVYTLRPLGGGWPSVELMGAVIESSVEAYLRESMRAKAAGRSIMKEEERDAQMFIDQKDGFEKIGVEMRRSNVWRW